MPARASRGARVSQQAPLLSSTQWRRGDQGVGMWLLVHTEKGHVPAATVRTASAGTPPSLVKRSFVNLKYNVLKDRVTDYKSKDLLAPTPR